MPLSIKNGGYAFLRLDIMSSMSLCHYEKCSIVTNFKRPVCQTIKLIFYQNDVEL